MAERRLVDRGLSLAGVFFKTPGMALRRLALLPATARGTAHAQAMPAPGPANGEPAGPVPNALERYFDANLSGPGIWKWRHYFEIYERHFARFVGKSPRIAEVGIYSGGSLGMWRSYFGAGSHVYGLDIQPECRAYEGEGVSVLIGDQADREFWRKVRAEVPPLDIVIDDGGHEPEQMIVTFEEAFAHLKPGGVFLCEDIHGAGQPFAAYIAALASELHAHGPDPAPDGQHAFGATPIQKQIESVHIYPLVVVVEKTARPPDRFVAPKRGTEWQPFL